MIRGPWAGTFGLWYSIASTSVCWPQVWLWNASHQWKCVSGAKYNLLPNSLQYTLE